jgi:hypothetical protein
VRANRGRFLGRLRVPRFDPKFEDACGRREEDEGVGKGSESAGGLSLRVDFSYLKLQKTKLNDCACDPRYVNLVA